MNVEIKKRKFRVAQEQMPMESGNYRGRTDAVGALIAVTIFLTSLITGNELYKKTNEPPNQAVVPKDLHKPETSQPLPNVNTPENELSPIPPQKIESEITEPEKQKNRPYLRGIIIPLEDNTRETNKSLNSPL